MSQISYLTTVADRHDTVPVLLRKLSQKLGVPARRTDSEYDTMFRLLRDGSWSLGTPLNYVNIAAHRRNIDPTPARHDSLQMLYYKFGMRTGFVIEGNMFLKRETIELALAAANAVIPPTPPTPPDPDFVSFVTRAGLTDGAQIAAVEQHIADLKLISAWSSAVAIYLFVGGTAAAHSENLKSASYPITWGGTVTHDANGITGSANGVGDTGVPANALSQNDGMISLYFRSLPAVGTQIDCGYDGAVNFTRMAHSVSGSLNNTRWAVNDLTNNARTKTFSLGLNTAFRRNATEIVARNSGGSSVFAANSSAPADRTFHILAQDAAPVPSGFSTANLSYFWIGAGLTDEQLTAYDASVQAFQTALGRAV